MQRLLLPLALVAALALAPAVAQAAPQQPGQPTSGPGGSAYSHGDYRVTYGGLGDNGWFVFEPTSPKPASAPVAIMLHGFGEFFGYPSQVGLIEHAVRKGSVVIYPRYMTSPATPCQGPFNMEPCETAAVTAIKDALQTLRADPSRVQPDVSRASYFGHSFGGIVTTNMLNAWKAHGIPEPRAVFLDDPHDGGFTGDDEPALDDDLSGIPSTTLFQCYSGAHGVLDDTSNVDPPNIKPDASCNSVFPKLKTIPPENKDLVMLVEDPHGTPALSSDHTTCGSLDPHDAYDWGFCWKTWDALLACAYTKTDCTTALGDTPQHRYVGTWSDGTPIRGLKIQDAGPIRSVPEPERQAEPSAAAPVAASVDRKPRARLGRTVRRRGRVVTLQGTASDDRGVRAVDVAVVLRRGSRCLQLSRRGRFGALARCDGPTAFLRATGTTRWTLTLPRQLRRGGYRIVVRATDTAGQRRRSAARAVRVR